MHPQTHSSSRGQSLVFMALAMVVFLGFVALAIDGGHLLTMRRRARTSADAAALAAANAWIRGSDWQAAAKTLAKKDGFDDADNHISVEVAQLDNATCQQLSGDNGASECACFQVSIKAQSPTIFAQFVGADTTSTGAVAVSHACKKTPLEYGYAVHSRDDLTADGGGGVMAWGKIRSDANITRSGMGHLWSFGGFPLPFGGEITAADDITCNGNFMFCNPMMNMMAIGPAMISTVASNVQRPPMPTLNLPQPDACNTNAAPVSCSDFSGVSDMRNEMMGMMSTFMGLPMGSISNFSNFTGMGSMGDMVNAFGQNFDDFFKDVQNGKYDGHCMVYPPGKYTQKITIPADQMAIFLDGPHCFTQDVTINGAAVGKNVNFYFENNSGISMEATSTVMLDAGNPMFMDWGGMLFYNASHVTLNAVGRSMLVGSIYAPNGDCNLTGAGMLMGWAQLLCNKIAFDGDFQAMLMYDQTHLYHVPAEISLVK